MNKKNFTITTHGNTGAKRKSVELMSDERTFIRDSINNTFGSRENFPVGKKISIPYGTKIYIGRITKTRNFVLDEIVRSGYSTE